MTLGRARVVGELSDPVGKMGILGIVPFILFLLSVPNLLLCYSKYCSLNFSLDPLMNVLNQLFAHLMSERLFLF